MRAEKKKDKDIPKSAIQEDSKRKLSKTVAELERRLHEEEKKNSIMTNKVKQFHQDKEKYKQKYALLKNQVVNHEADKTRMYKQLSVEEPLAAVVPPNEMSPLAKKSFSDL